MKAPKRKETKEEKKLRKARVEENLKRFDFRKSGRIKRTTRNRKCQQGLHDYREIKFKDNSENITFKEVLECIYCAKRQYLNVRHDKDRGIKKNTGE